MKKKNKFAVLLVLLLGLPTSVLQAKDNTEEMKKLYDKGVALFEKEEYKEAAEAFRELVEGRPKSQYYFNIGECEYLRKRYDLAKEAFDFFLEKTGDKADPQRRAHAEEVVKEIADALGYLDVDETTSLEVWVDNEHRSTTPMTKPIVIMSGERVVVLKKNGESVYETKVFVEQGKTVSVKQDKGQPEAEEPVAPPKTVSESEATQEKLETVPKPEKVSPLKYAGITITSIGGLVLVAGAATWGLTVSKSNQLADECPDKDQCDVSSKNLKEKGESLKSATIGLLAAGAAITTAGVIMTILGSKKNRTETQALKALPMTDGTMVGMTVQGRF